MYDLLIYNGTIYGMDDPKEVFSAMGITNQKIIKLFSADPQHPLTLASKVLNLHGDVVVPGFTDSHAHFIATAALNAVGKPISEFINGELVPKNIEGVKQKVQQIAEKQRSNKPLFFTNYVIASIEENRLPTTKEIDEWIPNRDVIFLTIDVHASSYSSSALTQMGFDPTQHEGILQGEEHEANYEKMMGILQRALKMHVLIDGIQQTINYALEHGIVAIDCMEGMTGLGNEKALKLFALIARASPLYLRLYPQVRNVDTFKKVKKRMMHPRAGGCGAWEMDGAVGAQSAAFYTEYRNQPGNTGTLLYPKEELIADLDRAYQNGFQITSHALGTRAIDHLLDAIQHVFNKHRDNTNVFRWRVDHFEFPSRKAIQLALNELHLVIAPQPGFNWIDANYPGMQTYDKYLLPEVVARQNPLNTIVKNGGIICGSSDSPVQALDPFLQIHGMVNFPIQSESLSVYEALRTYTYNGAFATFEENARGTLVIGKSADFIILDRNPFKIPKEDLINVQVKSTFIQGKHIKPKKKGMLRFLGQVLLNLPKKI